MYSLYIHALAIIPDYHENVIRMDAIIKHTHRGARHMRLKGRFWGVKP